MKAGQLSFLMVYKRWVNIQKLKCGKSYIFLGESWVYVCTVAFICILVFEQGTGKELKNFNYK